MTAVHNNRSLETAPPSSPCGLALAASRWMCIGTSNRPDASVMNSLFQSVGANRVTKAGGWKKWRKVFASRDSRAGDRETAASGGCKAPLASGRRVTSAAINHPRRCSSMNCCWHCPPATPPPRQSAGNKFACPLPGQTQPEQGFGIRTCESRLKLH